MSETDNLFKAYSVQEIASMLGIGKTKTRELLDSGILPVTKVGRQYFTSPKGMDHYFQIREEVGLPDIEKKGYRTRSLMLLPKEKRKHY